MGHGGADKYYNPADKVVNDGDTANAADLNNINTAIDASFEQVADNMDTLENTAVANSGESEKWANNAQGDEPNPAVNPGAYSALANAEEAAAWAAGVGGVDTEADGSTPITRSAKEYSEDCIADVVLTNADVVLTGLDVVDTNADVVLTNADVILTNADVVLTGQDLLDTGADLVLTNADVVLTGLDVVKANEWAEKAEDVEVETGQYSALHWAAKAAASATDQVPRTSTTGSAVMPRGTIAQRDGSPIIGYTRFNDDIGRLEVYDGYGWSALGTESRKNYLINGNFDLWQRGSTLSVAGHMADRWEMFLSGQTMVWTREDALLSTASLADAGPKYFSKFVVASGSASSDYVKLTQRIEDVRKLAGKTATLSFWAKSSLNSKIGVSLDQNFGSGGSATVTSIGAANVDTTTGWTRYSVEIDVSDIYTKTGGTESYLQLNLWLSAGTDYNAQTGSMGLESGDFYLSSVQLEVGTNVTAFEQLTEAQVETECHRYFFNAGAQSVLGSAGAIASSYIAHIINYPIVMRVTPTAAAGTWTYVANSKIGAVDTVGRRSTRIHIQSNAAFAYIEATLSSLTLDAEL